MKVKIIFLVVASLLTGCHNNKWEGVCYDEMVYPQAMKSVVIHHISNNSGSSVASLSSVISLNSLTMNDVELSYKSVMDSNLDGIFGDYGDVVVFGDKIKNSKNHIPIAVTVTVADKVTGDTYAKNTSVLGGDRVINVSSCPSSKDGNESDHSSVLVKYNGGVWVTSGDSNRSSKSAVMIGNVGDTSKGVDIIYSKHLSIINTGVGAYLIDGSDLMKTIKTPLQQPDGNRIISIKARHMGSAIVLVALMEDGTIEAYVKDGTAFNGGEVRFNKKATISRFFLANSDGSQNPAHIIVLTDGGLLSDVYLDSSGIATNGNINLSNVDSVQCFGDFIYAVTKSGKMYKGNVSNTHLQIDDDYSDIENIFSNRDELLILSKANNLYSINANGGHDSPLSGVIDVFADGEHDFLIKSVDGYYFHNRKSHIIKDADGGVITGELEPISTSFGGIYRFEDGDYLVDVRGVFISSYVGLNSGNGYVILPRSLIGTLDVHMSDLGVMFTGVSKSSHVTPFLICPASVGNDLKKKIQSEGAARVLSRDSERGSAFRGRIYITKSDVIALDDNGDVNQTSISSSSDGGSLTDVPWNIRDEITL